MCKNPDKIHITGEPQMDPNVCKFTVNRPVLESGSIRCTSREEAESSPLLKALFDIDGIARVLVYGNTIVLSKESDQDWPLLGRQIGAVIRETLSSDEPAIHQGMLERQPADQKLRARLEELFESQINPAIAGHGGQVQIVDVKGGALYVSFSGGCQGCAASSVTLKQGIEQLVFQNVPEIKEIIDMTDHEAGLNPYYS